MELASLAAERRTEADLEAMRHALADMQKAMGDPEAWCRAEPEFHGCVVRAARNGVMATIIEMLSRMLMESRKETVRLLTDYASSYRSHENVYLEIEKQDAAGAANMMMEHFALVERMAQQRTKADVASGQP